MNKIYQTDFIKRAQNLQNTGKSSGKKIEAYNPLCGDHQTIYLETKDGVIKNITFEAKSCMVSQVATDVIAEKLVGKSVNKAHEIEVDEIERLIGSTLTPSRKECATLGLSAIKQSFKGE